MMDNENRVLLASINTIPSIPSLLDRRALERPDAIALACASATTGWTRVSWARFAEDTRRVAAGLHELGVKGGDHVAVLLGNQNAYECFIAYGGLLRRGGVLVPLNTRSTVEELTHALEAADCQWLIAGTENVRTVEAVRSTLRRPLTIIKVGDGPEEWPDWGTVVRAPATLMDVGDDPNRLCNILFTSGTTSRPKGVMHTHRTAVAAGAILSEGLGLRATDTLHHAVPFFTSSGAQGLFMAMLWSGCGMVVEPVFDATRMVARMEKEGTTVVVAAPAQYIFMLDHLRANQGGLSRVRLWDYGGSSMPGEVVRALMEIFPGAEQRQNYGMTESGPTGTILPPAFTLSRLGSVGLRMPLCDIRIVDETGSVLPPDMVGEIQIRSPANMLGYYRDPDATEMTR